MLLRSSIALLLLPSGLALAETHSAGATIEQAASIDLTPDGLAAVAEIVPSLVPSSFDIPEVALSNNPDFPECLLLGYEFSLTNGAAYIEVMDIALIPQDGYLELTVDLAVWINESFDPAQLYLEAECIGGDCDLYVEPFLASVSTQLTLDLDASSGEPVLDATVGAVSVDYDLASEDIQLDGCALGTIEEILRFFGLSMFDLLLPLLDGYIDDAVGEFTPEIEALLEDAVGAASISQSLDLAGAELSIDLLPSDIEITTAGVRVYMDGAVTASASNPCVAAYDPGYSVGADSSIPPLGYAPSGIGSDYHAALHLSDDFGNQLLYSVWQGGLLCQNVDESLLGDSASFLTTALLLNPMTDNAAMELFPSAAPVTIALRPQAPPVMDFTSANDVGLVVPDLGMDLVAELDYRKARIVGVDLDVGAGANLAFDNTTGALNVEIDLSAATVDAEVVDNQYLPDASASIDDWFTNDFVNLVSTLAGSLLPELSFTLPAFSGLGLTELELAGAGSDQTWLGGYAWIGPVTYSSTDGCSEGCGSTGAGCEGGCDSSRGRGQWFLLGFPLLLAGLRRRAQGYGSTTR